MSEENLDQATDNTPDSLLSNNEPIELAEGEYFLSEGVKGVGEKPEWFNSDKFKSVAEQAKGQAELHKMLGSFTGAPKGGYELAEGLDKEDALVSTALEFATKTNMSQDATNEMLELVTTLGEVNNEIDREAELAKLGDNAPQRISTLENALKNKLGEGYDEVKDLITSADSIILAEALMKAHAPVKLPIDGGEHPQGLTWADIEKEMFKKDSNGRLLRSTDSSHNAKVERMMAEFGGNKSSHVVVG
ncbi:hypothetical protein [Pseudoalteromonas marina]|uniref:hypothetical protein n=1 Tax=Pseudoalteromonas marina TaxID=267375 RepID=UPI003C492744